MDLIREISALLQQIGFIKLIKYINNVYHIDKKNKYLTDKRVNLTFKTFQIAFIALIEFLLRTSSVNVINCYMKTIYKIIKHDGILKTEYSIISRIMPTLVIVLFMAEML